jgi:hypothetical protein
MDMNLQYLIDCARQHQTTESEREAQVRSFAYGNTHIENESITKADIEVAMTTLHAERESEPIRS